MQMSSKAMFCVVQKSSILGRTLAGNFRHSCQSWHGRQCIQNVHSQLCGRRRPPTWPSLIRPYLVTRRFFTPGEFNVPKSQKNRTESGPICCSVDTNGGVLPKNMSLFRRLPEMELELMLLSSPEYKWMKFRRQTPSSCHKHSLVMNKTSIIFTPMIHQQKNNDVLRLCRGSYLPLKNQSELKCHSRNISTTNSNLQGDPLPERRENVKDSSSPENGMGSSKTESVLKTKKKVWEENIWTIPNFLTVSRIFLTPYLGYLVVQHNFTLAGSLFVLAGFTDMLDGQIARTWPSQKSAFGSALDPLADKILISTLYITLSVVDLIPVALTALIFARDVSLIGAAFYVRYISLPPPLTFSRFFDGTNVTMKLKPTSISKVNTAIQLSLVCFTLAAPVFHFVDHPLLHGLWYLTAGTTIWSGLGYIFRKDTYEVYKTTQEAKAKYK